MDSLLLVGLGNPGSEYSNTPHNIGFALLDYLFEKWRLSSWQKKFQGLMAEHSLGSTKIKLLKPQTYMNLSGKSVVEALQFYKLSFETEFLVAADDLDTPLGETRLKKFGGSGGHNGLNSLIDHLGSNKFPRLRMGIGRDTRIPAASYVLAPWKKSAAPLVEA